MPTCSMTRRSGTVILSTAQLRLRYLAALSLIALLAIVSQAVLQYLIADQKFDSRVVNIAGRQRMLSQKIAKLSYSMAGTGSASDASSSRQELRTALALWQRSHDSLLHGDAEMGLPGRNSPEVQSLFQRIEPHYSAIVAAAQTILSPAANARELDSGRRQIREHEGGFLKGMDEIVFSYDREANAKVALTQRLEIALLALTLIVLLLEAKFIFSPAAKRIQQDMDEILDREKDMALLFAASPSALFLVDRKSLTILHANEKAANLVGISNEEIVNAPLTEFLDKSHDANGTFFDKIASGETLTDFEVVILDSQHSLMEALVSIRTVECAGQPVLVLGLTNVSDIKRAHQALEHYATFDEMTGLLNRRTGLTMLEKSVAQAKRSRRPLLACFVDLDGLKATNDTCGHAEGDWLIRTLANVLAQTIRCGDVAIRLGGDEFLLVLADCTREDGAKLVARAEKLLVEIAASAQKSYPLAFSYGLAAYAEERHATMDDLISEADSLMYRAKEEKKRQRAAMSSPL